MLYFLFFFPFFLAKVDYSGREDGKDGAAKRSGLWKGTAELHVLMSIFKETNNNKKTQK